MSPTHPATPDQSLIARVPMRVTGGGRCHYSIDQGEGGANVPPTSEPDPKSETVSDLEKQRIQAAVDAALKAEREAAAAKAQKDAEAAEEASAKEQGKWKEHAEKTEQKLAEEQRANRALRQSTMLADHLASEHPEYLPRKKFIAALISPDVDGEELVKAVKAATKEFVDANPIEKKPATAGAPSNRGSVRLPAGRQTAAAAAAAAVPHRTFTNETSWL